MPSQIRVDQIVDLNGTGAVELPYGATIPSGGTIDVSGNINVSGISTIGVMSATSAVVTGVVTATQFVGDGSALFNLTTGSTSKSIALAIIGS